MICTEIINTYYERKDSLQKAKRISKTDLISWGGHSEQLLNGLINSKKWN